MKKMLIITGIIFGSIFGIYVIKKGVFTYFVANYEMPPVTVTAATATPTIWQKYLSSIGTLNAINGTDLSAEASGVITEIHFVSGQNVAKGDVLVVLDSAVEQAELKNAEAQLSLAQINFDRLKSLLDKKVASQAEYDKAAAELNEIKATMQATQARIDQKTIRAPFSGKIGIRQVNIGQFIPAGTVIASLQDLAFLHVQFNLPEKYLMQLFVNQTVEISVDNGLDTKTKYQGTINAINSKINANNRNILVEATIPNPKLELYPGMFAQVKIWLKAKENVIVLPQTAISYSLHGDSVFLIEPDAKKKEKDGKPVLHATRQYIKVGDLRDDKVVIVDGLKANDEVVTSGQLKLQNNTHVLIDNKVEM